MIAISSSPEEGHLNHYGEISGCCGAMGVILGRKNKIIIPGGQSAILGPEEREGREGVSPNLLPGFLFEGWKGGRKS